jgi:RNA polymerase sigma-70 factor, ECF subfamily
MSEHKANGGDSDDPRAVAPGGGKPAPAASSKDRQATPTPEAALPPPSPATARSATPARLPVRGPSRVRTTSSRTPDRALQDVWVARLREGDSEALRDVVHAFGERLTAVVAGILRDRHAVDDVVQETFTKAFYRIASFKGGASLYTWLYRVAVNAAKDHIKSRKRRPASSFDEMPGRTSLSAAEPPLVEGLERRELRLRVRAAIEKLPTRFRAVLALREIEGMAYNDIAEVLGLSLGTVESRLFRARKRLRVLLIDASFEGPSDDAPPHDAKGHETKGTDS